MKKQSYFDKLKDPRWQKKRLQILERDEWKCTECKCTTRQLHAHHKVYFYGSDPWDYDDKYLTSLCDACHEYEHALQNESEYLVEYANQANITCIRVWRYLKCITFMHKYCPDSIVQLKSVLNSNTVDFDRKLFCKHMSNE